MRRSTALESQWKMEEQSDTLLHFENCKGGYFSIVDDFGLKVGGATAQASGTKTSSNLASVTSLDFSDEANTCTINFSSTLQTDKTYTLSFNIINWSSEVENGEITIDFGEQTGVTANYTGDISGATISLTVTEATDNLTFSFTNLSEGLISFTMSSISMTTTLSYPSPEKPEEIMCVKKGTKIVVCGKNLFPVKRFEGTSYLLLNSTDMKYSAWYGCLPIGTSVTTSTDAVVGSSDSKDIRFKYDIGSGDGTLFLTNYLHTGKNIKTAIKTLDIKPKNISCTRIYVGNNLSELCYVDNIQCEIGTEATEYEPYNGMEITVPCDLYEGDVWYPMTGKVIHTKNSILLHPTDNWVYYDASNNKCAIYPPKMINKVAGAGWGYCNISPKHNGWYADNLGCFFGASNNIFYLKLGTSRGTTLEEFKACLQSVYDNGGEVRIVYELKEPTIEQYDPQPIYAPNGIVNVFSIPVGKNELANLSATMMIHK